MQWKMMNVWHVDRSFVILHLLKINVKYIITYCCSDLKGPRYYIVLYTPSDGRIYRVGMAVIVFSVSASHANPRHTA